MNQWPSRMDRPVMTLKKTAENRMPSCARSKRKWISDRRLSGAGRRNAISASEKRRLARSPVNTQLITTNSTRNMAAEASISTITSCGMDQSPPDPDWPSVNRRQNPIIQK